MDSIEVHRFGLAGREALLLLLAASLLTFALTRLYTRRARTRGWRSGRVGDVHFHHMVVGIVLTLLSGMLDLSLQPGGIGRELLAVAFGVGAAFMLDEFALSLHLRDVYWTEEGRHSVQVSIMWVLFGLLLLVGISPFGIHDQTEIPRIVGFALVAFNMVLSVITCLKGKLTLGLLSVFLAPVGLAAAIRLARPDRSGRRSSTARIRRSSRAPSGGSTPSTRPPNAAGCGSATYWAARPTRRSPPTCSKPAQPPLDRGECGRHSCAAACGDDEEREHGAEQRAGEHVGRVVGADVDP